MNPCTQAHFTFVKELCDQYNVNCELLDTCFPTIRIYPKEFKQFDGSCRVPDYAQITLIFFEEDKVVKVCNGKGLEYRQFNSYIEQMMDLHY